MFLFSKTTYFIIYKKKNIEPRFRTIKNLKSSKTFKNKENIRVFLRKIQQFFTYKRLNPETKSIDTYSYVRYINLQ